MICIVSIVSAIYVVKFQKNAELFLAKKRSAFRKCGVFLSSANAEDKKHKKNNVGSTAARTRALTFAVHCSNHYSIPTSLESRLKIAYIKKNSKYFFRVKKNYKITFVGIPDKILWANFGDPVTSSFDKNSQKRLRQNVQNAELIFSRFYSAFQPF